MITLVRPHRFGWVCIGHLERPLGNEMDIWERPDGTLYLHKGSPTGGPLMLPVMMSQTTQQMSKYWNGEKS